MPVSQIISINDFDMYYEIHGTGEPLLLLHGFTGSGAALIRLFNDLTTTHQLIVPDLRGHGRSTNPLNKFTHRQAALDIIELLKILKVDHCNAIGFSAGGNILLHIAIQQSNLLTKMALVSATPYYPNEARNLMQHCTIATKSEDEWQSMRAIHIYGDEQIRMLWQQANDMCKSYDDMNLTSEDLKMIKTNTFIVQGDRDPLYPVEISIDMYHSIPKSSLWIIPNGGHVPLSADSISIFKNIYSKY